MAASVGKVSLLDYGAGNVRSLRNAIKTLGYEVDDISTAEEILQAKAILFPGVGRYGQAMKAINERGWFEALQTYLKAGRPFFGICLGMQSLFEGSEEDPGVPGLGIIPGMATRFVMTSPDVRVPQIGWNGLSVVKPSVMMEKIDVSSKAYFVHSFCVMPTTDNLDWVLSLTDYCGQRYVSMVQKGNICACQFHPEKSGKVGLDILGSFLARAGLVEDKANAGLTTVGNSVEKALEPFPKTELVKRVIACLDVRTNDQGDLVVTKGDQYDVREAPSSEGAAGGDAKGAVRNLGKPVSLCERYYADGADEVVFLNITNFRQGVLEDAPMLRVLEKASESVFVPLTVGGGIREYTDPDGHVWSALDVASRYFAAGADKVSIGSDAVAAAEEYLASGSATGGSCLEQISVHYGAQAVVVSVDPKRVYLVSPNTPNDAEQTPAGAVVMPLDESKGDLGGPNGEKFCWWQVTVKGGRETRPLCAVTFAKVCERLGAGEIMLNCIDMDGQGRGYDLPLLTAVQNAVTVPVIASSGAGKPEHFSTVFEATGVMAALAAGMFHRKEVEIAEVKAHLQERGIPARI